MTTNARTIVHFVDGKAVAPQGRETIPRYAPGSGELVAEVLAGTREDAAQAVAAARRAFDTGPWPRWTGDERAAVLLRLADLVDRDAGELARLDAEESGKPLAIADGDLAETAALIRHAAFLAPFVKGSSYVNNGDEHLGVTYREPVGVAALIVPWNFPVQILAQKLPFALAAGCTVVAKPSELTSSSAAHLARLCIEAAVPEGVVNIVVGSGAVVGQTLAESHDVDMISFTGSTAVGRAIVQASAGNLKKTMLELGGKGASVVFDDADLDRAVPHLVDAVTYNNGAVCISQPRVLVQRSIARELTDRLEERFAGVTVGQPLEPGFDMGALITPAHLEKVRGYVDRAAADGATVVTGGRVLDDGPYRGGQFIQATLVRDVTPETALFQDEVFGPVLGITEFDSEDDAVRLANGVGYGLAASVHGTDLNRVLHLTRSIRTGTVYVNSTLDAPAQMPFGGVKASGIGLEQGEEGLNEFTVLKTVSIRTW